MEKESFYIIIENRYYRNTYGNNDFHIEKLFHIDKVLELLNNIRIGSSGQDTIVITNDSKLLSKYLVTINEDELKKLCSLDTFNEKNIRINSEYFSNYNKEVYEYFTKIKDDKIISANMDFRLETTYPYDDESAGVDSHRYRGWIENKEFNYFLTPQRYKINENQNEIFEIENVNIGNISIIKSLINVDLLDIGNDSSKPNVNWEFRYDKLRYFDKISSKRIYINKETLAYINKNKDSIFTVETKLDYNHYIEYHITGIEKTDKDEVYIESENVIFHSNVINNLYYNHYSDISEENKDFWDEF
jgi:hypothetical protein